ncbi:MAG TPA: phosphoserine phosphatase SerB [Stellaceae bacterium]|nr:phosphoserine phosphatase SerB [Stellaceae bacterium]
MAASVLTLIAAPEAGARLAAAAAAAADAIAALGAKISGTDWLAPGIACDVLFDALDPGGADAAARAALGGAAVDVVAQPQAGRRKRLLVADLESTIIANEMLEELADAIGRRAEVAAITRRAMNGEIEFVAALKERVALLKDLPESVLATAGARIRIDPGAAALVATMRAQGARTALVSGGFGVFASPIRDALGFDLAVANELEIKAGRLTGTVREPILAGDSKLATLKRLAAELGLPLAATLAVGDGANDLPMIEAAGLGVAYHGKPAVAARARARIDHADLAALLYVQGYRSSEIIAA